MDDAIARVNVNWTDFEQLTNLIMLSRLYTILPLVGLAFGQNNASNNNYLGSTPYQRHSVNHTQAYAIIAAAVNESMALSIPVNIAVMDPSALVKCPC